MQDLLDVTERRVDDIVGRFKKQTSEFEMVKRKVQENEYVV